MDNRIGECVKVRAYFLSFEGYYIGLKPDGPIAFMIIF